MTTPADRFDAVYAAHQPAVLAYALRRLPAADADEVVAETFVTAWRCIERMPADPLPWLFGIARNVTRHQRRAAGRRAALSDRLRREPAPPHPTVGGDLAVLDALGRLGASDRELVMLVCWEGLSLPEAAAVLGTTHVAARVRLHRARRRLAGLLDDAPAGVRATTEEIA